MESSSSLLLPSRCGPFLFLSVKAENEREAIKTTEVPSPSLDDEKSSTAFLAREGEEQEEEEGVYQVIDRPSQVVELSVEYEKLTLLQALQDLQEFFPLQQPRIIQLVADRISEYVKNNGKVFGGMTLLSCFLGLGLVPAMILGACSTGLQARAPEIFDVVRREVWQLVSEQMQEDSAHLAIDGEVPTNLSSVRRNYKKLMQKAHPDKNQDGSATAATQQIVGAHERYCAFWGKGYRASTRCDVVELDTVGEEPG